ncbi:MAG: 23S rRNA (guanosine(2251)-2'-O)-methyltransferase RlmB [Planctomycetaceae bacterium]
MVGRRRKSSRKLAAGPQRSWLWGRHAVLEMLAAGRWRPLELRVADDLDSNVRATVETDARACNAPLTEHSSLQLTRWCGAAEHQGLLALMPPYPYLSIDAALAALRDPPLMLILDRIQDPHNFGAILRSAEVFGVDVVVIGEQAQCDVTPHVVRSSAGAVNHIGIARVADLSALPALLRQHCGARAFAAAGDSAQPVATADLRTATAIVIGNEGVGVSSELRSACDAAIRISQVGRIDSLNAAVAAGVLLYEVRRQRDELS